MTRESKNIIPPSPSDAAPVVGHVNIVRRTNEDCSHNLRIMKVMNCSQKLGTKDPWTLVNIWRLNRGKILTDNHVGLSIIGTLSDPV